MLYKHGIAYSPVFLKSGNVYNWEVMIKWIFIHCTTWKIDILKIYYLDDSRK